MSTDIKSVSAPDSSAKSSKKQKKGKGEKYDVFLTVLLILGCITILFPLYMTIIIALKSPSDMTNDVAGALSFPKQFSLENFAEAMRVTNFWNSLGNSLIITVATIVLALVIHSMAGYAIGRAMGRSKKFKLIYFYIVSGMFVPFAILMM
ncbi:MAG: carbohydrate ABC transporter permease, partial [Oscillospiraceae bacterium]